MLQSWAQHPIPRRSIVKTMAGMLLSAPALIAKRALGADPMRVPDYAQEIRAYMRSGLSQDEIAACEESARTLLQQYERLSAIEVQLLDECKRWDGAAAVRNEDWFGFVRDATNPGLLHGHPFARRFALRGLEEYEKAGVFERIDQASRAPRWPHWSNIDSWLAGEGLGGYIGMTRGLCLAGRLRCLAAAERPDAATLEQTLRMMLGLARMVGHERGFLIDRLICISHMEVAASTIRDIVMQQHATPEILAAAGRALGETAPAIRDGFFDGERLYLLASIHRDVIKDNPEQMFFWPSFVKTVNALYAELNRLVQLPYAQRPPFSSAAFLKRRRHWWNPLDHKFDGYIELANSLSSIDALVPDYLPSPHSRSSRSSTLRATSCIATTSSAAFAMTHTTMRPHQNAKRGAPLARW